MEISSGQHTATKKLREQDKDIKRGVASGNSGSVL